MKVLPVLAAALILVEVGASAVFLLSGPWLLGLLLAVAAACTGWVAFRVVRAVRRPPPTVAGYVESERVFY